MINQATFVKVDYSAPADPELGAALMRDDISGILVKNFLSPEEVAAMKQGLADMSEDKKIRINQGFISYPMTFAQFTQMKAAGAISEEGYIGAADDLRGSFERQFGVDLEKRTCDYIRSVFRAKDVTPIYYKEPNKYLIPYTFRELLPTHGELIMHCENLFFQEFPEFSRWLKKMDVKENRLSYFITLQAAEEGGELCCFDLNWKDVKTRLEYNTVQTESGQVINVDEDQSLARTFIKPSPGDLLLFSGGNTWHRVEKVRGTKSRITIGGFVAATNTDDVYYLWS